MRDRPAGISDRDLCSAVADSWQLDVAAAEYVPVGGGSYHWIVRDRTGCRWFATVDDLDQKRWLGDSRDAVANGLATALELAIALRDEARLPFVLAPVRAPNGAAVVHLGFAHAVALFPYVPGACGVFGRELRAHERQAVVDMLAALHSAAPQDARVPLHRVELARRDDLETALGERGRPWDGGPFSEPARARSSMAMRSGSSTCWVTSTGWPITSQPWSPSSPMASRTLPISSTPRPGPC